MTQRRNTANLTDYRSVLHTTGEIEIGAYARRQRRRRWLIAGLGVVLIGAAVVVYQALRPATSMAAGELSYTVEVQCISCGYNTTAKVSSGQAFPLACPRCNERGCKPVLQCRNKDCNARFAAKEGVEGVRCPKCGGLEVGSAAAPPRP